jgi:hypothetical protein
MFRRRPKADAADASEVTPPQQDATQPEVPDDGTRKPTRANGPWDVEEVDGSHPSHARARVDLGGLRVRPLPGMQLQMQVDSATGRATSVLMVSEQAAVQLMAIAAAKSTPLWPATINAVAVDARRRGGSADKATGPWGEVLNVSLPVQTTDGASAVQPSIVIGVDGPRWLLRATLIGAAATDQAMHNRLLAVVQDTVVVRGEVPMPPGEIIELKPPTRVEQAPAGDAADGADAADPGQSDPAADEPEQPIRG